MRARAKQRKALSRRQKRVVHNDDADDDADDMMLMMTIMVLHLPNSSRSEQRESSI